MSAAYREGWDRIFDPPLPRLIRCPFNLRRGLTIHVDVPSDLKLRDLRRFVQYLATMCDDWEVEMGLPVLSFDREQS
jgi:hypothetical protein